MRVISNHHRGGQKLAPTAPYPSTEAQKVAELLSLCPVARETPLVDAHALGTPGKIWVKDERGRMELGSFKALGAAYVIARHAELANPQPDSVTLSGQTYVTASAGNHGMSVAAGAKVFGANAVVYIAETVPESFAERLREKNAKVVRSGDDYAASMTAAMNAAQENGWILLSDSSWDAYFDLPHMLMEGYLKMADEAARQCPFVPSHVVLQAGVGGLAGAVAAYARKIWGDEPTIVVVEPETAPALQASIEAGECVFADGPESIMGRLDCKEPSLIALNGLARDADFFVTLSDSEVAEQLPMMAAADLSTTASGGAGIAALLRDDVRQSLGFGPQSSALCFLSETVE